MSGPTKSGEHEAASPQPWLPRLRVPRGWTLDMRDIGGRLSITVASPEARATVILDLETRETVASSGGSFAERGIVIRFVNDLITARQHHDLDDPGTTFRPVPAMVADDVATWSSMQVLAAITAGRWSLSPLFGGSAAEDRRVNGAFLTTVWGL